MNRAEAIRFSRYVVVSGLTWLIDLGVFLMLYASLGIPGALLLARVVAGVFAFLAHKRSSFGSRDPANPRELAGYILLVLVNYVLSVILVMAFRGHTQLMLIAAKIAAEMVIFVLNYLLLSNLFLSRPQGD
ncbi:MAG: GtrA family protein [Mesorhizobium sp.]|nr:MAG: GtrA family protein [Mesorhizobium sp.]